MLSEQEQIRRESLQKIISYGINPYPAEEFKFSHYSSQILENFIDGENVIIAGRLMRRKIQGKASFGSIQDVKGKIQIYLNRDIICPDEDKSMYNDVFKKWLDLGDILGIEGKVFKTRVGEISVNVEKIHLLSKSLKPLPQPKVDADGITHDAFNDPELRYRRRYVDLLVNDYVKETFLKRSKVINSMRKFLSKKDYVEVETPILQSIPGGAAAKPFVTHHNALDVPLYLRIANELYLKRLIVGGFEGVYEFAKDFRNEGMDKTHNPEFTQMEVYVAYKDYHWMMSFTEEMLEFICLDVLGTTDVKIGNNTISFKKPFKRISMLDSIKEHTGIDISKMGVKELFETCKKLNIETNDSMGKGKLIDEIFGEKCESNYLQPTFITDYPIEMSPLCKKHRDNDELTERFELMVNGKELANAYSELNDPIDQKLRFEEQTKLAERGDDEAMLIDLDFIRALEYGMPPTSGMGIGIDRLVMFLCNQSSIQEVLLFPQMKPEKWDTGPNKKEYLKLNIAESWIQPLY
jgi:lysyl-tRNA synthetase class 2